MKKCIKFVTMFFTVCCITFMSRDVLASKSTFSQVTGKKLIEITWGPPRPEFVMENIQEMENRPFDGVIMRPFFGSGQIFNIENFRKHRELTSKQFDKYAPINSDKLTDNFLAMYATSNMDWFNDEDWKDILEYVSLIAKGAKKLGCVGLVFDAEAYGHSPWIYQDQIHHKTKSYDEYVTQIRQRGREFMETINTEFPDAKILFLNDAYAQAYKISDNPDKQIREAKLQSSKRYKYALYLPFYIGILEACHGNNRMIGSTQGAYYNSSASEYYEQYWIANQGSKIFVPQELRKKFSIYNRAASNVYIDTLMAGNQGVLSPLSATARELTLPQRLKWLEYNTYQALKTADEYAWFYGEQISWWKEKHKAVLNPFRDQIAEAAVSAKYKLMHGHDIGFEVKPFVNVAKQKAEERKNSLAARIKPKTTKVKRIADAPVIDGKLDDAVYKEVSWLDEFVSFAETGSKPTVPTRAWAAYDDQNLYLAFRNLETDISKQKIYERDIWHGETIDISLLKPGELPRNPHAIYFHLMLNPENQRFNRIDQGTSGTDEPFRANWQSAASRDSKGWYVEIALPWRELGFDTVEKGMSIHLNLARHRAAVVQEFTTWSQVANKFQEAENFGTLILE